MISIKLGCIEIALASCFIRSSHGVSNAKDLTVMTKPLLAILLLLPLSVSAGIVIWKREVPVGIRR